MRRFSFAASLITALCAIAALFPATGAAQDNSAIDQYVEQVPNAGGKKPAQKPRRDSGGSSGKDGSSGSDSDSGDDGAAGAGGSDGDDGAAGAGGSDGGSDESKKKRKKDKADEANRSESDSATSSGDAGDLARASVPPPQGGGGGDGGFPVLAVGLLTLLAIAAGVAWWRFRGRGRGDVASEPSAN